MRISITSSEGEVRAATVQTTLGKMFNRALNFLYPSECSVLSTKLAKLEQTVNDNETPDDVTPKRRQDTLSLLLGMQVITFMFKYSTIEEQPGVLMLSCVTYKRFDNQT